MDLHQYAVLQEAGAVADAAGEPIHSDPIEIRCRWNDHRRQVLDRDRTPIAIDATVVIDRVIKEGSLMWKGTLVDFMGTDSDDPELSMMKVLVADDTKSIHGIYTRNTVHLGYHKAQESV